MAEGRQRMISILEHEAIRFAGAQDLARRATGITPRRLPSSAAHEVHDPIFQFTAAMASGIRIVFASDTDAVEIDAMLTGIEWPEVRAPSPRVDLVVDRHTVATRQSKDGRR